MLVNRHHWGILNIGSCGAKNVKLFSSFAYNVSLMGLFKSKLFRFAYFGILFGIQ